MTGKYTMQEIFNMMEVYNKVAKQIGQRTRVMVQFGEVYGPICDNQVFTDYEMFKETVKEAYITEYGKYLLTNVFEIGSTNELAYDFGKYGGKVKSLYWVNLVERDVY